MTPERLAEIEKRERAATSGPWEWVGHSIYAADGFVLYIFHGSDGRMECEPADEEFIVHSRQDVCDLLAEVKRLTDQRDRAIAG